MSTEAEREGKLFNLQIGCESTHTYKNFLCIEHKGCMTQLATFRRDESISAYYTACLKVLKKVEAYNPIT